MHTTLENRLDIGTFWFRPLVPVNDVVKNSVQCSHLKEN